MVPVKWSDDDTQTWGKGGVPYPALALLSMRG